MGDDALLLRARHITCDHLWIKLAGIDVEATTGLHEFPNDKADDKRDGGNHLEIDERLDADPADFLKVAHGRDSMHYRAEDHRRDHHFYELNEAIAQRLQGSAGCGIKITDQNPSDYGNQNLQV